jgi:hypothetical protein
LEDDINQGNEEVAEYIQEIVTSEEDKILRYFN